MGLNSADPCYVGLICIIIFIVCIAIIITILCLNKKNIYHGRSDESLVYFTGFGDSPSVWDKVQSLIKKSEFKDIAIIDAGSSENLNTRASEILETLPEAPYVFIAHSGGALLAMTIQQLIPDNINKVILIDPTPLSLAKNVPNPIPSNIPKSQADAMKMVANSNVDKLFEGVKEFKNIYAIIDITKPRDINKLTESELLYSNSPYLIITKNLGHHIQTTEKGCEIIYKIIVGLDNRNIEKYMKKWTPPSFILADTNNNYNIKYYVNNKSEIFTLNQKFMIGSITKLFVAALALIILPPETPIYELTLYHFATHHTNLHHWPSELYNTILDNPISAIELVNLFKLPLSISAVSEYNYSSYNYLLIGELIEKTTGKKWYESLNDLILNPLNLTNTGFGTRVRGFDESHGKLIDVTNNKIYLVDSSAGGLYSSCNDLVTFGSKIFELIPPDRIPIFKQCFQPPPKFVRDEVGDGLIHTGLCVGGMSHIIIKNTNISIFLSDISHGVLDWYEENKKSGP